MPSTQPHKQTHTHTLTIYTHMHLHSSTVCKVTQLMRCPAHRCPPWLQTWQSTAIVQAGVLRLMLAAAAALRARNSHHLCQSVIQCELCTRQRAWIVMHCVQAKVMCSRVAAAAPPLRAETHTTCACDQCQIGK
jgi:hypothetical protein